MFRAVAFAAAAVALAAGKGHKACGPGTGFDATVGACVPIASLKVDEPTITTSRRNVEVRLPAGKAFSVSCPEGGAVACSGAGVHVVDGKCVAKEAPLLKDEALEIIGAALQKQLDAHTKKLNAMTDALEATRAGVLRPITTANKDNSDKLAASAKSITDAKTNLDQFVSKLKNDFTGSLAAGGKRVDKVIATSSDKAKLATQVYTTYTTKNSECVAKGEVGYDSKANKCVGAIKTGQRSCYEIWTKNVAAKSDGVLMDGIYTIKVKGKDRKVWCDFNDKAGNSGPGWTLVARISRYSRKHMLKTEYGKLEGPWQAKPWKLSDADINEIKKVNGGISGKPRNAIKFGCTSNTEQNQARRAGWGGYQYFDRACTFNANRRVDNYQGRKCLYWAPTETTSQTVSGYGDSNDCGLGGHHAHGTIASYGWHYCSSDGNGRQGSLRGQGETMRPSSNTGCGHNYRYSRQDMQSGDGTLWIK